MQSLKGIKIFGYGTLIPMALISQTTNSNTIIYESQISSIGVSTPINNEETDQMLINNNNNQVDEEYCVNSPTRISSSNDIMALDKMIQEPNGTSRQINNNELMNSNIVPKDNDDCINGLVFSDELIGKIIEKAEFGRVVMGIDDI